jgi:hypothetical protein
MGTTTPLVTVWAPVSGTAMATILVAVTVTVWATLPAKLTVVDVAGEPETAILIMRSKA